MAERWISNGDRAKAQWRCFWEPMDPARHCHTLKSVVDQCVAGITAEQKKRPPEEAMLEVWEEVVGSLIAQHARPDRIRHNVLYIRVLQPAIHYTLERTLKVEILEKMRARFGRDKIRDIKFFIG